MKIKNEILKLKTKAAVDFIDITDKVQTKIKESKIVNGVVNIQSLHTTVAIVVNENEPLLIEDMKNLLEKLAPRSHNYSHDNFEIRTVNMCNDECKNGHAHNKAIHLPTSAIMNVVNSALQLGQWQKVFVVELDRSRPRQVALQIMGE